MENATNKCQWLHTFKGSWCTVLGKGLGAGYVASVMRGRIARFCLVLTLRGGGGGGGIGVVHRMVAVPLTAALVARTTFAMCIYWPMSWSQLITQTALCVRECYRSISNEGWRGKL